MLLRASGVDQVFIDNGVIAEQVREVLPGSVDKVLELVGNTLVDSLLSAKQHGIVCITGVVSDGRSLDTFSPIDTIPTAVCLTTYHGGAEHFRLTPLEELVETIADGRLPIQIAKVFKLDRIADAHRFMEENKGAGKIVVLT